jgi:hypothetical protein
MLESNLKELMAYFNYTFMETDEIYNEYKDSDY